MSRVANLVFALLLIGALGVFLIFLISIDYSKYLIPQSIQEGQAPSSSTKPDVEALDATPTPGSQSDTTKPDVEPSLVPPHETRSSDAEDKEAVDKNDPNGDAADKDAADKEAADKEAADKDAADKEVKNLESPSQEAATLIENSASTSDAPVIP